MALIKFGGGVVQMSGSIAGDTFARNRYGNYSRARTKPTNPNTAGQQRARQALTQLTTRWAQTLTAAQRTAWNLYASNVAMKNRLGETINLTGFNHYIRSNSILLQTGLTIVDAGPTVFELPETDPSYAVAASEATQELTITYDDTMAWCDEDAARVFHYLGLPQNGQRNFFAGPWFYQGRTDGSAAAPPASPHVEAAHYVVSEGQHIWVYGRIVRADGRLSQPFRCDCAVGA